MVLYKDIESVLKINSYLRKPFKVTRGIRQGSSLSGMLCALCIEPMLNVRCSIAGMSLAGFKMLFSLSASAADIIVVFVSSQQDVNKLGDLFAELPQLPGGLKWKIGSLKYLGVYLGGEDTENKTCMYRHTTVNFSSKANIGHKAWGQERKKERRIID